MTCPVCDSFGCSRNLDHTRKGDCLVAPRESPTLGEQMDFDTALIAWLNACQTQVVDVQVNAEWVARTGNPYRILKVSGGSKFLKIVAEGNSSSSAWAFVATKDGESKAMGKWKKGDIFRPATYKAPAKHARGNIFDLSNGPTCNVKQWTGPDYLK